MQGSHLYKSPMEAYAAEKVGEALAAEPTEAQWGGLARQIMMWLDMGDKTPRALFRHLERSGEPIPDWLRNELEMQALDHVPSKGTRCVLIYKAMQAANHHHGGNDADT